MLSKSHLALLAVSLVFCGVLLHAGEREERSSAQATTSVADESWLNHLHPPSGALPGRSQASAQVSDVKPSDGISDGAITLGLIGMAALVMTFITAGLCFAAYELARLGREGVQRAVEGKPHLEFAHEGQELVLR